MPESVLHAGAVVACAHGGSATPTVPSLRVNVGGNPVVTAATPYLVTGCAAPPPPAGTGPCVVAHWVTAATRVTSLGQPLLLRSSQAVSVPNGTPLQVLNAQTRVLAR